MFISTFFQKDFAQKGDLNVISGIHENNTNDK